MSDIDLSKLADKFAPSDIEWRIQQSGDKDGKVWAMCLAYVTNRAIMDRLDEVCGPENWRNEFTKGPDGGVLCGISIKTIPSSPCELRLDSRGDKDGTLSFSGGSEWVTKWDGADNTDIESVKGGLSSAMKRAGVQWGIGRYLYHLDATWADVRTDGRFRAKTKDNKWFKWSPPQLPSWALPQPAAAAPQQPAQPPPEPQPVVDVANLAATPEAARVIESIGGCATAGAVRNVMKGKGMKELEADYPDDHKLAWAYGTETGKFLKWKEAQP